ncbi:TetR/AcrR family transcriptional regulator [Actinokineospora bangkokensis]|uniref:HTH tetR-type domain-containing protein n=1 Tax=Actinokineospora bangkokensis TaxID=1193682 RepID=A0A1Q9LMV8_9PSEU|nr:TetR/AcrR family transcriptional regulator [Actinokineospora bangkokensis]OLR93324.1 hypothetical protein BJP25_17780 [Actinokineospora bangkokensis]
MNLYRVKLYVEYSERVTGLRERKKWETRRRISDAATALFMARGFDGVTVAEVAQTAGVSKMTVFNYFPRKEDLVLDRSAEIRAAITTALRTLAPAAGVAPVLHDLHRTWLAQRHPISGVVLHSKPFWELVMHTPALRSRWAEQREELADAVAEVCRELGAPAAESVLVAGFVVTAHRATFTAATERILAGDPADDVERDQVAFVDTTFAALSRAVSGFAWAAGRA